MKAYTLGRHVSVAGGIHNAPEYAEELGCNAMQVFISNPRSWSMAKIDGHEEKEYEKAAEKHGIKVAVAHMPYLPNLASPKKDTRDKSLKSLADNLKGCDELHIPYLVTHLGSSMGSDKKASLKGIAELVSEAMEAKAKCSILFENQAGTKNSVGSDLNDLAELRDLLPTASAGFCLDTCHAFAAGYDLRKTETIERIGSELGFGNIKCLHLNDAMFELGSHRDRHQNIGFGYIGTAGFRTLLSHDGISSKPLILETPISENIDPGEEIMLVKSMIS